jgi:two-component system sensor histidine kinase YesM
MDREHSEIILRQQSEYAQLQSQINPHFLYNTLESIRGQAIIDDNYKIAEMTEALGKYFRYNIGKDNYEVTLGEELGNIKNYIYIQQYRFQDKFEFHIYNHDASGMSLNCIIPKMTLQPIVENAIYHGMENKTEKGNINIHIETTKDRLIILVADDGGGMDKKTLDILKEKLKSSDGIISKEEGKFGNNGIAMENVNNRLRLLFGEKYGIKVSSTLDYGTEVELTIPVIYKS